MNLDTQLKRALYGSPLHRTGGKIALAAILIGLFVYALPNFKMYYLTQPLAMAAALPLTVLTRVLCFDMDRRAPMLRAPRLAWQRGGQKRRWPPGPAGVGREHAT